MAPSLLLCYSPAQFNGLKHFVGLTNLCRILNILFTAAEQAPKRQLRPGKSWFLACVRSEII